MGKSILVASFIIVFINIQLKWSEVSPFPFFQHAYSHGVPHATIIRTHNFELIIIKNTKKIQFILFARIRPLTNTMFREDRRRN